MGAEIKEETLGKIIECLKYKVVNECKMEIDEILTDVSATWLGCDKEANGEVYNFCIDFVFFGSNSEGVKSIYGSSCIVSGFLTNEEEERQLSWDYKNFSVDSSVESIRDIKITNLAKDAYENHQVLDCDLLGQGWPIDEVIYKNYNDKGFEIVYRQENSDDIFYLELDGKKSPWEPMRIISVDYFVEADGDLYVHPNTYSPEFDFEKTPFFKLEAEPEYIETVINKIENIRKYELMYRNLNFSIYRVDNSYRLVLNKYILWCDEEGNISDILQEGNYYYIGITGSVEEIIPVCYNEKCYEKTGHCDVFRDDKTYIKNFEPEYDVSMELRRDEPAEDMYIVRMKDGTQGFLFVNLDEAKIQRDSQNETTYVKKIIYTYSGNNQTNKKD